MELKFFTDLIDALGKVAAGLKAIVNLLKAERTAIKTFGNAFRQMLGNAPHCQDKGHTALARAAYGDGMFSIARVPFMVGWASHS